MSFKAVLLLVLVCCAAVCTGQGGLPLTYPARELLGTNISCAPDGLRQATRQSISNEVQGLIVNSLIPEIFRTAPPECTCLATGRRVAYLDMTDLTQQCPPAWRQYSFPRRTCQRNTNSNSCDRVVYPTNGTLYNRVCGRIVAYQCGEPEGFTSSTASTPDTRYVDGITITHALQGLFLPQHVWSYAAVTDTGDTGTSNCPCGVTSSSSVPGFVGNNYFCDSIPTSNFATCNPNTGEGFLTSRPLWSGQGCGFGNDCCEYNGPPWFCTELPSATTDDIVVSLCGNGISGGGEDTPIELIEIYVS